MTTPEKLDTSRKTTSNPDSADNLQRFVVMLANDLPPATLFTNDREIRLATLETANVLARDAYEAVALANKAGAMDDLRPLGALTAGDLKTMALMLENFPFTDEHRVEYTRKGQTATELKRIADAKRSKVSSVAK